MRKKMAQAQALLEKQKREAEKNNSLPFVQNTTNTSILINNFNSVGTNKIGKRPQSKGRVNYNSQAFSPS